MHRVIAGCCIWSLVLLAGAGLLGWLRSPYHVGVGLFAAVFALLAQCASFMLFMGASKLVKAHLEIYPLGRDFLDRTNAIMFPLFRWASVGSLSVLAFTILGGLAASDDVPVMVHSVAGLATIGLLAFAVKREVRAFALMHQVLRSLEAALPEPAPEGPPAPGPLGAPERSEPRLRALVYVGSTVLFMALGYRFVAGLPLSNSVLALAIGAGLGCLGVAAILARRERGASQAR